MMSVLRVAQMMSRLGPLAIAVSLVLSPVGAAIELPLPSDSVYHLALHLTDQNGVTQAFAASRGTTQIVTMFYASCAYVCPMTIETLKGIEANLTAQERARLRIMLVSLDPERDSAMALKRVAEQRKVDEARWTLARTERENARKLAAVLGIQYRQLKNKEFNHSTVLALLDVNGRVLARTNRLGKPDAEFVAAVRKALSAL